MHRLRHEAQSAEPGPAGSSPVLLGQTLGNLIHTMNTYHYQAIDESGYLCVNCMHA